MSEGESRVLTCPRDGAEMNQEVYEADITVDVCPQCGGVWLDKGELESIQETVEKDYSKELSHLPDRLGAMSARLKQEAAPPVSCPLCSGEMARKEYGYTSQILIDTCPSCRGIWLDKGELQALEVFFERSQLDKREARRGFWASLIGIFS